MEDFSSRVRATSFDRRDFLSVLATGAVAATGCYEPLGLSTAVCTVPPRPVRVRGRVLGDAKGLLGVQVTDGITVQPTGPDGDFSFISSSTRPYVYISVPDGYKIPQDHSGIAKFYRRLDLCNGGDEAELLFELTRLDHGMEHHLMIMLADPQVADSADVQRLKRETLPELIRLARDRNGLETFAVGCGDLVSGRLSLFGAYEDAMGELGIPFFQVPGNHDVIRSALTDAGAKAAYVARYGPPYYSFDRGAIHYVFLDNVFWQGDGYAGYVSPEQVGWLAADLSLVEPGRTVVVCQHVPMLGTRHLRYGRASPNATQSVVNRDELCRLLEPYRAYILAGHVHESAHIVGDKIEEHHNGAVCGAFWTGPICADGTPNGYVIYEASGEEIRGRYKAVGRPLESQMSLYPPGTDPASPADFIANVWFWDPEWIVKWYEDGEPRGLMDRRTGLDPLAVKLYGSPARPKRYPWVKPLRTDHLFRAIPNPGASAITVEATDRFGRVFTTTMKPYTRDTGGGTVLDSVTGPPHP